jgi:hypothetical protein
MTHAIGLARLGIGGFFRVRHAEEADRGGRLQIAARAS